MNLKIGTRGSRLALMQSQWVKGEIEARHPHVRVELVRIKTTGDRVVDAPLSKIGGKGLFVKEIEEALLENRVDLAVHSMKDVPAELPDGLMLSTFPQRENPADALISAKGETLDQLFPGARVGTSSLRRGAQLLHLRPDLELVPLRGNVDTRLSKLESGDLDAVILASAGLSRLGLSGRITHLLSFDQVLPAVGQGALGIEVRQNDVRTLDLLHFLDHKPTRTCVIAERAFLKELEGGCQVPIAGLALLEGGRLFVQGMVAELDGTTILRDQIFGTADQAGEIGTALAGRLLAAGADRILERIYGKEFQSR
ncbi:MAG: hydroxymethylbilane synthase [Deltaproteobacteria bacterium]|nr:hydroxymethylbilane synthase [Deltaproteobacteria bacterium]MBW2109994.1 hydroxymethylbilane synthase [Deltaproteobacteria bacterium]MBW2351805.1 hydroxymethylbilane synthase [Deltaproteobacteria bacterium]HDZ89070.1 hydroxymethylbilane synthase [Deltaproteobacteria bacterium]